MLYQLRGVHAQANEHSVADVVASPVLGARVADGGAARRPHNTGHNISLAPSIRLATATDSISPQPPRTRTVDSLCCRSIAGRPPFGSGTHRQLSWRRVRLTMVSRQPLRRPGPHSQSRRSSGMEPSTPGGARIPLRNVYERPSRYARRVSAVSARQRAINRT